VTAVRVALFAEDRNFVDFLLPAVELVAGKGGRRITWVAREHLSGCRAKLLRHEVGRKSAGVDLVIVGADAAGRHHASRGGGHRRKRADLHAWLDNDPRICVVVADPCVEAWLYCEPSAFARGVSRALEKPFRNPAKWPVPRTEADAKNQLGRLISEGVGGDLIPRNGFEFSREIVESILDETPTCPSLRDSLHDIAQALSLCG
jgi:hypothetical protein